jgi:hypothetical protein
VEALTGVNRKLDRATSRGDQALLLTIGPGLRATLQRTDFEGLSTSLADLQDDETKVGDVIIIITIITIITIIIIIITTIIIIITIITTIIIIIIIRP